MDEKRARRRLSGKLVMIFLYSFQGFATTFIINRMMANNRAFPREAISTLCRLPGWRGKEDTWALHIKEVMERHPRFQCLHLQAKACMWGILEALIGVNLVWGRANTRFIEMTESCALIGQGGSAFFSTFFLVLVQVRPLRLVERASMWRAWEKRAQVIYPQASNRRSNHYLNEINQSRTLNLKQQ